MVEAPQQRAAYQRLLKRLQKARKEAGFTQVEVARKLGRDQSWVSKKESGERRMDPIELCDFAKLYQLPIHSFVPEFPE